jgi:undecaprenyl pyrophosphate phosphatase UppP
LRSWSGCTLRPRSRCWCSFRAEWARIIAGLLRSVRRRRIETADERLGWMLVAATIPAGLFGLAFEYALRVLFARPLAAAAFMTVNGLLLLAGEGLRRRSAGRSGSRPGWIPSACAAGPRRTWPPWPSRPAAPRG